MFKLYYLVKYIFCVKCLEQYTCFTVNLNFYNIFFHFLKRFHFFEKRHTLGLYSILFVLLFLKMSIALCSLCPYPLEH